MSRAGQLGAVVLCGAVVYALLGGEYGTGDWLELRQQERAERLLIDSLTVEVDSLKAFAKRLETDRRLQERLARENFGMIRKGEFLYRLEPDTLDSP